MSAFTTSAVPAASGSIISGIPQASIHYTQYSKGFSNALKRAIHTLVEEYEAKVKSMALTAWGSVADEIELVFDLSSMSVYFDLPDELLAYEYGDAENPPQPVIRIMMEEIARELPMKVSKRLKEALG